MTLYEADNTAIDLVGYLHTRHQEISAEFGSISNIITLFFHELIAHYTGIFIHRSTSTDYGDGIYLPWVNKKYAMSPFTYPDSSFRLSHVDRNQRVNLIRALSVLPLTLGNSIPFGYKQKRLFSRILKLVSRYEKPFRMYLPKIEEQSRYLREVNDDICGRYSIPNSSIVAENWHRYVDLHTCSYSKKINSRGLLVGTRNDLHNRKLAIAFLQQDKKVIGMTHGEISNSIFDEPVFGYSERTLCTELVDYGDFDADNEMSKKLMTPNVIHRRSSSVIASHFKPSEEIVGPKCGKANVLYIPTMHQSNFLWGPFHAHENSIYDRWQQALIDSIDSLTIKLHPKTRSQRAYACKVEARRLDDCIADYDVLVIDYIATGAALAIFSEKPVVYFDIGLRRLNSEFRESLERRCICSSIDLKGDLSCQIKIALSQCHDGKARSNLYLAKYALCRTSKEVTFTDLVRRILYN